MSDLARRLDRLEERIGAASCVCQARGGIAIVVIEAGWTQERIRQAEADAAGSCPVHGTQGSPVLRLVGSDVYG